MKTKALAIAGAAVAGVVAAGTGVYFLVKRKSTAAQPLPTRAPTTPGFTSVGVAPPGGNDVLSTISGIAGAATAVTSAVSSISKQFGFNF